MGDYILMNGELYHWGIKGMRWGIRRYQNADGTLTEAGKRRYLNADGTYNEAGNLRNFKAVEKHVKNAVGIGAGRLGKTVGVDPDITALADKVQAAQHLREVASRKEASLRNKQEQEDHRKYNAFLKKFHRHPNEKEEQKMERETYLKYKKDIDVAEREAKKRSAEFENVVNQVVGDYLGKYGDAPVNSRGLTAKKWLAIELEWGNATRNFRSRNQ